MLIEDSMSSWIIARNVQPKKKTTAVKYYDLSTSHDMVSLYLNYLSSYIYSLKMGEPFNLWEPTYVIQNTLRQVPQVKFLKEFPKDGTLIQESSYQPFASSMKFKDVQKIASDIISYDSAFNRAVVNVIDKAGIKSMFDIGIHLIRDISGPNLTAFKMYGEILRDYQKKTKKNTLLVYVMADNYNVVTQFQSYCDPSWKLVSLSKTPAMSSDDMFIHQMADIQIMTAVPALALDFSLTADRFIYLMQRYKGGLTFFKEVKDRTWNLF